MNLVTAETVRPFFKPRLKESHKGTYGHVVLVGGSVNKPGAILLAGRAALRTGSGLVTVVLPDKAFRKFPKKFLELMYEPVPSTATGTLSQKSSAQILKLLKGRKTVALGPGLGVNQDTRTLVTEIVRKSPIPVLLDADALNALAKSKTFPKAKAPLILTPHSGEMSRLTKTPTPTSPGGRLEVASTFAMKNGVVVILKGYRTVTALPDGRVFVNSTGNPGMATAGMGDVLAGVITSLIGQGLSPDQAAIAGVFLHGRAGDRVAERLGDRGLLATDVIEEIPLVLKELILP